MQIKNLLFAAGLASALPTTNEIDTRANQAPFQIMALRSASPIHFSHVSASEGFLYLNMAKSGASCDRKQSNSAATFSLTKAGELYLYSTDNPPQQIWSDRSGMGQGITGYITGAQPAPRNASLKGWKIDKSGNLSIDNAGFLACPVANSKQYRVWVSNGVANPGGSKNCLGFNARTVVSSNPNSCTYTSS